MEADNLLLRIIDQYCYIDEENHGRTHYNCTAEAVDYLSRKGYIDITKGSWPRTKHLKFYFTPAGRKVMNEI
jgi:hypothetical protein